MFRVGVTADCQGPAIALLSEMRKGGEFPRVSVKREGERYLVYLPMMR